MKYFSVKELVDKQTYNLLGEASIDLISPKLIETIEELRERLDLPMIINNWYHGGKFQYRGYRNETCGVGKPGGAHYKGMAVDFDCYENGHLLHSGETIMRILRIIDKFPHIRCIEKDVNWVHIDVMGEEDSDKRKGVNEKSILFYSPKTGSKVISRDEL